MKKSRCGKWRRHSWKDVPKLGRKDRKWGRAIVGQMSEVSSLMGRCGGRMDCHQFATIRLLYAIFDDLFGTFLGGRLLVGFGFPHSFS